MTSIPFLLCCVIFTWPSVRRNISFIGSPTQKIVSREAKFFGQAADRICLQAGTGRPANSSGAFIKRLPWGPKKRFEWSHSGTTLLTALIRLRQSMKYMLCDAGKHRARKIGLPSLTFLGWISPAEEAKRAICSGFLRFRPARRGVKINRPGNGQTEKGKKSVLVKDQGGSGSPGGGAGLPDEDFGAFRRVGVSEFP